MIYRSKFPVANWPSDFASPVHSLPSKGLDNHTKAIVVKISEYIIKTIYRE